MKNKLTTPEATKALNDLLLTDKDADSLGYSFQEIIELMSAIGLKLDLPKLANQLEENECEFTDGVMTTSTFIAHNLLDTYLTNYDMKDVSREIIKLIEK